jgi:aerobic-type carbon monoxide dehydrogenase small subunit (CoxS/CutS family)
MPAREKPSPPRPRTAPADPSRRGFLESVGLGVAGLSLSATAREGVEGESPPLPPGVAARFGPGPVPMTFRLNGREVTVEVEPRTTLLAALRDRLELTGAKEVCDRGACGGCTVLLDGRPVTACMVLALDAREREVTTIEGLAQGEGLDPLQSAFIDHDALMCGYCTPGMIMAAKGLLLENPSPDEEQVRRALSGNLCRCGTYPQVFRAVHAASGRREG